MTGQRWKRILMFGGIGFLVLAFVGFLANFLRPPLPIVVGPNTTVIESPLADDGLPDYAEFCISASPTTPTLTKTEPLPTGGLLDGAQWKTTFGNSFANV